MVKLDRIKLLAAELFGYSFDNYADHVAVGNARFTRLMPNDIRTLIKAKKENWTDEQVARALEIEAKEVKNYFERFEAAKKIVDAINPSESFRNAVKESIRQALKDKLTNEEMDELVIQICFRAADLGYLLKLEDSKLSDYSEWLRREKEVDYSGIGLPNLE